MKINILIGLLLILGLMSCDNYLDVTPKGMVIPETVKDYDLLLNGGGYSVHTTSDEDLLFFSADDYEVTDEMLGELNDPNNKQVRYYRWKTDLFPELLPVSMWDRSYSNIYTFNLIINEIDGASITSDNTDADKLRIKAEARTNRAYEYWLLVNAFAKQYMVGTAPNDAGVPLVTEANATAETGHRSTVEEVYAFIIADLSESLEYLPDIPINRVRPAKSTAYGLLARVCLQKGDYKQAEMYASKAIEAKGVLSDYTNEEVETSDLYSSEQYINRYYSATSGFFGGFFTEELESLFDLNNDMRVNRLAGEQISWVYDPELGWYQVASGKLVNSGAVEVNHSVSVAEMFLIRAECNVRLHPGDIQVVIDDLNTLRSKRISSYVDLTQADFLNAESLLKFVLEERRREMFLTGMRWFDLKRLNTESDLAITITHIIAEEVYTLEPLSNRYVFPIPADVMNFNPAMEQNIRD